MMRIHVRNMRKATMLHIAAAGLGGAALSAFATGDPASPIAMALLIPSGAAFALGEKFKRTPDPVWARETDGGMGDMPESLPSDFYQGGALDPTLQRVIDICTGALKESVVLAPETVTFDGKGRDRQVTSFALRCTTSSRFADDSVVSNVTTAISAVPVPSGTPVWKTKVDPKNDLLYFTGTSTIPERAYPPHWHVVQSVEEAGKFFKKFELEYGLGEDGPVRVPIEVFPHSVVIATSGGGKSVMLLGGLERLRAAGAICLLGDGKGYDYAAYHGLPNVVAIGAGGTANGMAYFGLIEIAYRLMQDRADTAPIRKMEDPQNWMNVPPVILILDEIKSMLKIWRTSTTLSKKDVQVMEGTVNLVLALGRGTRVHVQGATQDAYDASIPRTWLGNMSIKLSLKKPTKHTVNTAFEEVLRPEVFRAAAGFDDRIRGRGLVAGSDEESGQSVIQEFQGYYSYAPGEEWPDDDRGKSEWAAFKKNVSDRIPRLYSRMWFKLDQPSDAQREIEDSTGQPLGYVDFDMFTPGEIKTLDLVNLDMRDADNNWVPDPAMIKYDPSPQNLAYVGRAPAKGKNNRLPSVS